MNDLLPPPPPYPPLFNVNRSSNSEITAIQSQGHVCGQRSRSHLRPWVQSICLFSFLGNRTIFGWGIANSIFDHKNSGSRSWPRLNPMVTTRLFKSYRVNKNLCPAAYEPVQKYRATPGIPGWLNLDIIIIITIIRNHIYFITLNSFFKKSVRFYNHSLKCTGQRNDCQADNNLDLLVFREICVNEKKAWVYSFHLLLKKVHKSKHILYNNKLICKTPWAF